MARGNSKVLNLHKYEIVQSHFLILNFEFIILNLSEASGADVLKFLDSIIPDTAEVQLIGQQEAMRIMLTQVLRDARSSSNMTQEQIAAAVNKDAEWVEYVEDCNHPMCVDDFVTYMRALGACFEITVNLPNGSSVKLDSNGAII